MDGGSGVTTDGTDSADEDVGERAREDGVPLGGTAEFLMWLRVGTVVPFISFLCGDSNGLGARNRPSDSARDSIRGDWECVHVCFLASAGDGPTLDYTTRKSNYFMCFVESTG
jgi:hypothetical protein